MQKQNYQLALDQVLRSLPPNRKPRLLLHACCAPCSSYVLEYLSPYFQITLFYYNPNISSKDEYEKRVAEVRRLLQEMPLPTPVSFLPGRYDPERFLAMAKGMETLPEGGERCFACYRLRLTEAAKAAKESSFDFFTTTLSISPHKNAQMLNQIGMELAETYGVTWLPGDFKKRGGFQRSIVLSQQYHLYRQNYCGCVYSAAEAARRRKESTL
ncbi:epoxyqueuosine reductase QueH [Caproicibacterium lactatifermentans]|uniref:Epoxyqueuosine reductase QueH n=1 Tax=Caproicibacterium lactatifermentans TaxID=2666138 RepID=A0A859DM40_9FIRM|nr:epoxyqueuosine reductase QueH [Caproicibacterium lactatifermentans]ARP49454.1 hypothetical protein B6259_00240 [Ruminococcaceae bacterium CPB6]MDD4806949.1 epoxyqueuosine reductase QueH [Oscillospiraceae bacterium]QKN23047.1 hypothetical protein GJQ69_00245 [Caproicibacterium lactatifermentans]QKO30347.1 hypothetical protein GKP14_04535 [Caproicibacterium lactatifermentans]